MIGMWDEIGYIMASKYRTIVIEKLSIKNYMPSTLAKETKFQLSHISRALKELTGKKLTICLNEKSKKGKIYTLTEFGRKLSNIIKKEIQT